MVLVNIDREPIWNGDAHQYSSITLTIKEFRTNSDFVRNGRQSTKTGSIKLLTESGDVLMNNHCDLEGTLALMTGISESWYTWDYVGNKDIFPD